MATLECGSSALKPEMKHLIIQNQIDILENSISRLESLCDKIENSSEKGAAIESAKPISLAEFLLTSPKQIEELNTRLNVIIGRLEGSLF